MTVESAPNDTTLMDREIGQQTPEGDDSGHEYLIVLPFIVIFGLCGNCISLVAIFHSRLRKMAANQYLIVLTVADSVFLFGIILVLFKVDYVGFVPCVLVEYVLMTASYVSSWSIAALTLERYIAIAHPLKHVQYGHMSRVKMMACWLPIPFVLNTVQFLTLTPMPDSGSRKCGIHDAGRLQLITELADVILCYCLPCCVVVLLNIIIASNIRSSAKNFHIGRSSATPPLRPQSASSMSRAARSNKSPKSSIIIGGNFEPNSEHKLSTPSTRALPNSARSGSSPSGTRILLVVPVVYILLNTPFYLFRILDTVALNLFDSTLFQGEGLANNPALAWLYNMAHYLYYVNFACDVIVYAFSSANFRRTVLIAWRRLLCPKWMGSTKEPTLLHTRCNTLAAAQHSSHNSSVKLCAAKQRLLPSSHSQPSNCDIITGGVAVGTPGTPHSSRPSSRTRISLEVDSNSDGLAMHAKRVVSLIEQQKE